MPQKMKQEQLIGLPVKVLDGGYFVVGGDEVYHAPEIRQHAGDCLLVNQQVGAVEMNVYQRRGDSLERGGLICRARRTDLVPLS